MNCRELALVSTAAVFGALASSLTCRFFFSNPKRPSAKLDLPKNGVVSGNALLRAVLTLRSAKDICHGMIISWQLHFYQLKDPKTLTGWSLLSECKWCNSSYVCHAEVNASLNTNHASAAGQRLYVTMFPCNECAKIIIQSGVAEVVYFVEKRLNNPDVAYIASHKLLSLAGAKVRKHQPYNKLVNGSSCSR